MSGLDIETNPDSFGGPFLFWGRGKHLARGGASFARRDWRVNFSGAPASCVRLKVPQSGIFENGLSRTDGRFRGSRSGRCRRPGRKAPQRPRVPRQTAF